MLFRIALYKDGVFVRHLSGRELETLRVSPEGIVQQRQWIISSDTTKVLEPNYEKWVDVSDTHKVEWGTDRSKFTNPVYENDVLGYGKGGPWILYSVIDLHDEEMHMKYRHIDYDKAPIGYRHTMKVEH